MTITIASVVAVATFALALSRSVTAWHRTAVTARITRPSEEIGCGNRNLFPRRAWPWDSRRALRRVDRELPGLLEGLARSLRGGATLGQAIATVEPTPGLLADDWRGVQSRLSTVGVVDALDDWARTRPRPAVRLAVTALALSAETGGAQARAIDGVAGVLRQRRALVAEAHALSAQARASAVVMVAAPLAFLFFSLLGDPNLAAFVFGSPLGLFVLSSGLAFDALGGWWMSALIRRSPR